MLDDFSVPSVKFPVRTTGEAFFSLKTVEHYRGRFCWIWQYFKSLLIPLDVENTITDKYLVHQDLGFKSGLNTIRRSR